MQKTILITGSTDGIGLEAARALASMGHRVLLHGRTPAKLEAARQGVLAGATGYLADLSDLSAVRAFAETIAAGHPDLDVLINNAGVLGARGYTADGLDLRFAVNTIAPYLLAQRLMGALPADGRVVNISSAAQAPVNLRALAGGVPMPDMAAYSQSKLAMMAWSRHVAAANPGGPVVVSVNPGSMLGSKMVQQAFGVAGRDIGIGAQILARAAVDPSFSDASGRYFDNDAGRFGTPHPDVLDDRKCAAIVEAIEAVVRS